MFAGIDGGRFAGGTNRNNSINTLLCLMIDQGLERLVIHLSFTKRGYQSGITACEHGRRVVGSDAVTSKGKNTLWSQRDLAFEDKLGWSREGDLPEA